MRKESLEFLETFLNTPTPSGFEGPGARIWRQYVKPFVDEVRGDVYGNSIAVVNPGGSPKVMLAGHIDEIGFMITYINDDGFAYVQAIGGIDPAVVVSKPVVIHGATIAATAIEPKAAIAVDVAQSVDTPDTRKERFGDTRLGLGPVLSIGSVISPRMRELIMKAAKKKKIPVQLNTASRRSGTDADAIFNKCGGVATGLISVANRYMHTPVEVIDLKDLEQTAILMAATCEEITDKTDFVQ